MRTPSARTASELQKAITEPVFIVRLGLMPVVYLSTRGPTLWAGNVYEDANLELLGLDYEDNGNTVVSLRFDSAYGQLAIDGALIGKSLFVRALWGQEPFADEDAIVLFGGVISDANISRNWTEIEGRGVNSAVLTVPALFYDHQNVQPAGTEITIRANTFVIEQG